MAAVPPTILGYRWRYPSPPVRTGLPLTLPQESSLLPSTSRPPTTSIGHGGQSSPRASWTSSGSSATCADSARCRSPRLRPHSGAAVYSCRALIAPGLSDGPQRDHRGTHRSSGRAAATRCQRRHVRRRGRSHRTRLRRAEPVLDQRGQLFASDVITKVGGEDHVGQFGYRGGPKSGPRRRTRGWISLRLRSTQCARRDVLWVVLDPGVLVSALGTGFPAKLLREIRSGDLQPIFSLAVE
jgi:hypothetical protein